MANLKDTMVFGKLTVTDSVVIQGEIKNSQIEAIQQKINNSITVFSGNFAPTDEIEAENGDIYLQLE